MFLLGGSYRAEDDGVVVELYGRNRAGESVAARYTGFRPYFLLVEPAPADLERLQADPEVREIAPATVWLAGADRRAVRVTLGSPWKVPDYREQYRRPGDFPNVLSCDIPFVHRFLYDKGLGPTVRFSAEPESEAVRERYAVREVVRVVAGEGGDIGPAPDFRPKLTILAFDIENAIRERTIFTICGVVSRDGEVVRRFRIASPDEREMLLAFARVVEESDPDVLTGYNIGGYDLPLLQERAKALGLPQLPLGRDRSEARDMGERLWRIAGRVVADAWWSARRELRPKQESLEFVARQLLGEGKLDVDRRRIEEEWARDPERVQQYCEHDAELALRILLKLRALDKAADLATVAHLPLEEGLNGRTSLFIDAMLVPRADRLGIGVPPTHRARRDSAIEGGYVHTIRPGLYRWVVVLDFKAMYPSLIIAKNICFTTLSPEGTTQAPSGARFLDPSVRRGVIPAILEELLADRDRFRRLSRTSESAELRAYYDGLQGAVKVLMNSFYGVLASSFYRFTDKQIGAAITAFAREAITSIIRELEADGEEVVYSDTDSVFVRSREPSLAGAREFGERLSKRFTAAGATFEFQSVYEALFSHGAKKRYVGRTAWPREELIIRGYETRRSDAFDFQSDSLVEIFDLVLRGETERVLQRARELVESCRTGQVPVEKLVIARSVRPEEEYNEATRENLPFLRVFRQLKQEGYDVIPGMKVAWIVTDARHSPQEVEPWREGRTLTRAPDYTYYAERVAQTLARVTEVYGWGASELLQGHRQRRLDHAESAGATPDPPAGWDAPVSSLGRKTKGRQTRLGDGPA